MIFVDNYVGAWDDEELYQILQIGTADGITFARPNVLYSGSVYRYIAPPTEVSPATDPITYKTPDTDSSAVNLYTQGGVVATPTFGQINVTTTTVTAAALALVTGGVLSNITITTPNIILPQNLAPTRFEVLLNVTTAATSGATFTLTTANSAVATGVTVKSVGASATGVDLLFAGFILTGASANPQLSIVASAVTGTVTINPTGIILIG